MDVVWVSDAWMKEWGKGWLHSYRKYDNTVLTGNITKDKILLNYFISDVNTLQNKLDTVNGYSIEFSKKSKYQDVVNVLDLVNTIDHEKLGFIAYNNKVYVTGLNWKKKNSNLISLLDNDIVPYIPPPPTLYERFISEIEKLRDQYVKDGRSLLPLWPSMLILLIMISLTVFKKNRYIYFSSKK